jgi:hypothetical protein
MDVLDEILDRSISVWRETEQMLELVGTSVPSGGNERDSMSLNPAVSKTEAMFSKEATTSLVSDPHNSRPCTNQPWDNLHEDQNLVGRYKSSVDIASENIRLLQERISVLEKRLL